MKAPKGHIYEHNFTKSKGFHYTRNFDGYCQHSHLDVAVVIFQTLGIEPIPAYLLIYSTF
jgi:hypothetical protein